MHSDKMITVYAEEGSLSATAYHGINEDTAEYIILCLDEDPSDIIVSGDGYYILDVGAYIKETDEYGNEEGGWYELVLMVYINSKYIEAPAWEMPDVGFKPWTIGENKA